MNNPLPAPVPRKRQHTRTIECNGYLRADGLYDVEGRLVDVKSISFHNMDRGDVKPGEPIHEMWIRLTVDIDLNVVDVAATTVWGPYNMCGDIAPAFKCLKGLTIGPGWTRKTRELLAGIKGCGPTDALDVKEVIPVEAGDIGDGRTGMGALDGEAVAFRGFAHLQVQLFHA